MIAENPLAPSPASTRILWLPGDSRHYDFDSGFGARRNVAGVRVDPETALQSTVVLACARVLAESVASLPLHLYRRVEDGGKTIARENPLYRLLHDQPNGWQTSFEWREQQMLHLCLHGNAYSEIRIGSAGVAIELVPLHPSRMRVERVENGRLRYRYREENGRETVYTQEAIMHLRWLSDDGVNGMVPVELARDAIGLARACEIHGASFFGNGARPGVILTTEQMIAAEAAETLRNNWERMHRGPDRAQRTAVLTGGLKPIELGGNNQEAQFLEARRFQVEEICRLYRVPPHLVGDLTRSSFSNIEQQSIDFVQHTLLGWLRRFESAFTRDLIVDDGTYFVEFDTRGLLRGDASARASYYNTMHQLGVLSLNEIRAAENLNPVDGGDIRVVPLNMQTLEQANAAAQAASQPAPAEPMPAVAEGVPVVAPEAEAEPQVAEISLNGAQITGLIAIVQSISDGLVSREGAAAMIAAAFPSISAAQIDAILAGVVERQPAAPQPLEPSQRAQPGSVGEGDFVSWGSAGGRARGRIDYVMGDGTLDVPGTDFKIDSTEDDPAALITVYEEVSGGWRATETQVGHKVATLTKIDPLPEPPAKRDCGTGAGGFKPGNKCAGGGDGGSDGSGGGSSGGSGDSSDGSSGGAGQAKPGDGPLVKAARDEHKKALDKFRKSIETANQKAEEKHLKAMNDHIDAKEALAGQWSKISELTTKYEELLAQGQQDLENESLWDRVRQAGADVTQAKVGLEPFEKAEAAAKKAKERAAEDRRTATARAFKKEIAAIDKEDGITAVERKTVADAIRRHNERGESFAGTGFESEQLARSAYARSVRTESQKYLRDHVNNTIHGRALQGEIDYTDGVRASAGGGVFEREDGTEFGAVGRTHLDPTDSHRTFVHEFGHQIEHGNPEARALAEDFLRSRIGASETESLKERFPTSAYRDDEKGLPDDFAKAFEATGESAEHAMWKAYYTGKDYRSKDREAIKMKTPTEVLSMGMELMYRNPIAFSKADPEWFDLVSGISTGRLLTKTRQQRKRKQ